jgi:hypothetical protein
LVHFKREKKILLETSTSTTLETLTTLDAGIVGRRRRRSTSIAGRFNGPQKY